MLSTALHSTFYQELFDRKLLKSEPAALLNADLTVYIRPICHSLISLLAASIFSTVASGQGQPWSVTSPQWTKTTVTPFTKVRNGRKKSTCPSVHNLSRILAVLQILPVYLPSFSHSSVRNSRVTKISRSTQIKSNMALMMVDRPQPITTS